MTRQTCSVPRLFAALAMAVAALLAPRAASAYSDIGQSPDMVAWEIFAQAVASSGAPGAKQLEFETWASEDDLYGKSPPQWPISGAPQSPGQCKQFFDRDAAKAIGFPDDSCILEEVRRNWAAYRYIVSQELYSKAGLAKAFQQGIKVDLPADAVQVKADWIKIGDLTRWLSIEEEDVRKIYYTKIENDGATSTEYALMGLSLNSKRWKNLVWATFEHRGNPGRCDEMGCHDTFGASIAHVIGRDPANQDYGDCQKSPELVAMFANVGLGPVWLNYCLKGAQVDFAQKDGRPTLLGNSFIDRLNGRIPLAHSSCITCHALASFDKAGEPNGVFADDAIGDVDQKRLQDYATNGFVWGVTMAK